MNRRVIVFVSSAVLSSIAVAFFVSRAIVSRLAEDMGDQLAALTGPSNSKPVSRSSSLSSESPYPFDFHQHLNRTKSFQINAVNTINKPGARLPEINKNAASLAAKSSLSTPKSIFVRRSVVASAVNRRLRPSASYVAKTDTRPAGLIVHGWQSAGAGLMDGDIITRVAGRTPTCVEDVINAVIGAYQRQPAAVSGRVWRNGNEISVTVQLPIVQQSNTAQPSTSQQPSEMNHRPSKTETKRDYKR